MGSPDFVYLYGVGCTSGSEDCMAAGEDALDGGVVIPLGPGQDGLEQSVDPYRMNGASCFAEDYCIASGATETETGVSGLAVGEKIGTDKISMEWGGSGIGSLSGASCHSDNSYTCVAVGSSMNGKKGVVLPIVSRTSGKTESVPGVTGLNGVECEGTSYCVAVGQNSSGEGVLVGITGSSVEATVPVPGTSRIGRGRLHKQHVVHRGRGGQLQRGCAGRVLVAAAIIRSAGPTNRATALRSRPAGSGWSPRRSG